MDTQLLESAKCMLPQSKYELKWFQPLIYLFMLMSLSACQMHHPEGGTTINGTIVIYASSSSSSTGSSNGFDSSSGGHVQPIPCKPLTYGGKVYEGHCQHTPPNPSPKPPNCYYKEPSCQTIFGLCLNPPRPFWYCGPPGGSSSSSSTSTSTSTSSSSGSTSTGSTSTGSTGSTTGSTSGNPLRCIVGGCNRELCGQEGDSLISPCIFRPEFACYRDATCTRQANGRCGWTMDQRLINCLNGSSSSGSTSTGSTGSTSTSSTGSTSTSSTGSTSTSSTGSTSTGSTGSTSTSSTGSTSTGSTGSTSSSGIGGSCTTVCPFGSSRSGQQVQGTLNIMQVCIPATGACGDNLNQQQDAFCVGKPNGTECTFTCNITNNVPRTVPGVCLPVIFSAGGCKDPTNQCAGQSQPQ